MIKRCFEVNEMHIKGEYRDILENDKGTISDSGWRSNDIVKDYGKFLAALMKKTFTEKVGIEYMAVGSGSNNNAELFKTKVKEFFASDNLNLPYKSDSYWVWAKKIDTNDITYLDENEQEVNTITDKLKIDVQFGADEPSPETLIFQEFALLGIESSLDTEKMFFIDYVDHGLITKNKSMNLKRTVRLTFPINKNEEEI